MLRHDAALALGKLTRGSPGGQPTHRKSLDIIANNKTDQKVMGISSLQHYSLVENSIDHSIFLLKAYTMMFSYHQVKEHPKLLLAKTGLTHEEFAQLLPHVQSAWDENVHHKYIDRDNRKRQYGGGRPSRLWSISRISCTSSYMVAPLLTVVTNTSAPPGVVVPVRDARAAWVAPSAAAGQEMTATPGWSSNDP